jgi:hypothetical protein
LSTAGWPTVPIIDSSVNQPARLGHHWLGARKELSVMYTPAALLIFVNQIDYQLVLEFGCDQSFAESVRSDSVAATPPVLLAVAVESDLLVFGWFVLLVGQRTASQ